jgi:hypothetical protein
MATVEPVDLSMELKRAVACENCGTTLLGGFCHQCGQSAEPPPDSVRKLIAALVSDVFSFNSRTARSLRHLMVRPGVLTRAYVDGARVRYTQPLQLYLIAAAVFFLVNSFRPFVRVDEKSGVIASSLSVMRAGKVLEAEDSAAIRARGLSMETFRERFRLGATKNLPTFMIGSILLFALALAAFYWHVPRAGLTHLVFSLHWCAFYLLLMVFERIVPGPGDALAGSAVPISAIVAFRATIALLALVSLAVALRRVYRQSWWMTIPKSLGLFFIFNVILALWVVSVMMFVFLTL